MTHQVFHPFDIVTPDFRGEEFLAGCHPVAVALDGVDFAVVAHHPERLSKRPSGEGVGREALVIERNGYLVIRIGEIQIECAQRGWHGKRLVGNQATGKRRHVEAVDFLGALFDFAAAEVKLTLKMIGIHRLRARQNQVLDLRACLQRDPTESVRVHRHFAPADFHDTTAGDDLFSESADFVGFSGVFRWKKEHSDGEIRVVFDLEAELGRRFAEKRVGDLGEHAGTIAGFHVRIHRAAMGHAANRGQCVIKHLVAAFSMNLGDGTHAAVVMFLGKPMQGTGDERCAGMVERVHQ